MTLQNTLRFVFTGIALSLGSAAAQQSAVADDAVPEAFVVGAKKQVPSESLSEGELVVIYEYGELTIKATRVPLLQVLRRVCKELGAYIEEPSGTSEAIVADLGPGPVREVLTSLLGGSSFNYVMQAAEDDPARLARLLIIPLGIHEEGSSPNVVVESHPPRITPKAVARPEQSAAMQEAVDAKQTQAQMREFIAETKQQLAASGADTDESLNQGAMQLLAELEQSMDTLIDKAGESETEPTTSAPGVDNLRVGRLPHPRRR